MTAEDAWLVAEFLQKGRVTRRRDGEAEGARDLEDWSKWRLKGNATPGPHKNKKAKVLLQLARKRAYQNANES
jgi:hypothetical protein